MQNQQQYAPGSPMEAVNMVTTQPGMPAVEAPYAEGSPMAAVSQYSTQDTQETVQPSIDDPLGIKKFNTNSPNIRRLQDFYVNNAQLTRKQSEYIQRFKAKNPAYASENDRDLYLSIASHDPEINEKYGDPDTPIIEQIKDPFQNLFYGAIEGIDEMSNLGATLMRPITSLSDSIVEGLTGREQDSKAQQKAASDMVKGYVRGNVVEKGLGDESIMRDIGSYIPAIATTIGTGGTSAATQIGGKVATKLGGGLLAQGAGLAVGGGLEGLAVETLATGGKPDPTNVALGFAIPPALFGTVKGVVGGTQMARSGVRSAMEGIQGALGKATTPEIKGTATKVMADAVGEMFGMQGDDLLYFEKHPDLLRRWENGEIKPEALRNMVETQVNKIDDMISENGQLYDQIRQIDTQTTRGEVSATVADALKKRFGIDFDVGLDQNGKTLVSFFDTGSLGEEAKKIVGGIFEEIDGKFAGGKEFIGTKGLLDLRKTMGRLSRWDSTVSNNTRDAYKGVYGAYTGLTKQKIPEIAALDDQFSALKDFLRESGEGILTKEGEMKKNAYTKIMALGRKGNERALEQFEKLVPGIRKQIERMQVISHLETANMKAGAYTNAGMRLGIADIGRGTLFGGLLGGIPGALLGAFVGKLLLNPTTAAKLASKLGAMRHGLAPEVDNVVADIVKNIGSRMGKTDNAIRTAVEKSRADKVAKEAIEKTKKSVIQSATESKNPFIRQVQPAGSANYGRAKNTIENVYDKSGKPRASNVTAGTPERRGVIVTPQGTEIKALPPGQPVWKQMQDGQYQDPKGYYKALDKELMADRSLRLDEVYHNGKRTSWDELTEEMATRGISTYDEFLDLKFKRSNIKEPTFLKVLEDVQGTKQWNAIEYADEMKEMAKMDTEIGLFREMFGDQADDIIKSVRYMQKNGRNEAVTNIGKNGKNAQYLRNLEDATAEFNARTGHDLTTDELYNLANDELLKHQKRHGKFQTLAARYEVAPEISVKQAREIMGDNFPVRIVDRLETPEGQKAMGMYYQGAIEIAKNPVSTTGYHEAFHGWLDMFGDTRLRKAAFDQVKKERGFVDDLDVEEYLAEAFAEWKLVGKGSYTGAIKQFLQKIWNDIKGIIGKQDDVVKLFGEVGKTKKLNELKKNTLFQEVGYQSPNGLTTKVLEQIKDRKVVGKEYIQNLLKAQDIKQVEKDIFAEKLAGFGDKVDVAELSTQIRAELLPLKASTTKHVTQYGPGKEEYISPRKAHYEYVSLPDDIRGNVKEYYENIYNSPVKTSAGNKHFAQAHPLEKQGYFGHSRIEDMADGGTRRVIEVQSDLYQKGGLDKEKMIGHNDKGISKLQQYSDPTAHFRMVREEIATAAKDGKKNLQFPTGETAMKIEGLTGDAGQWMRSSAGEEIDDLTLQNIKIGQEIQNVTGEWIITEVLGDGKFKAVQKRMVEIYDRSADIGKLNPDELKNLLGSSESFDISGKVDANNPIYKFYENEMQKYLKKFDMRRVTDEQGVEWFEVPIKEEYGKTPVQAFQRK